MNAVSIVLAVLLALAVGVAVWRMRKNRHGGCAGTCAGCPGCAQREKPKKEKNRE